MHVMGGIRGSLTPHEKHRPLTPPVLFDVEDIRDELQDSLLFLSSTENIEEVSFYSTNVVCREDKGSASSGFQCVNIAANDLRA